MRKLSGLLCCSIALWPIVAGASAPPDLAVHAFTADVDNGTVTFFAEICNESAKTGSPACSVGLYYDQLAAPGCSTAADVMLQLPPLPAGQCETFSHTRSATPLGEYLAWILADWSCSVAEGGESDNAASAPYSVMPKLKISAVTATVADDNVAYQITARNEDVDVMSGLSLALYFDRLAVPGCGDPPDQLWPLASLPAGAAVTRSFNRTAVATGVYQAWGFIDQGCVVDEDTEIDNAMGASYLVGPNLRLMQARAQASGPTVSYAVDVCNHGSATVAAAEVALWHDLNTVPDCSTGSPDTIWTIAPLAPGACVSRSDLRDDLGVGSYTARFLADSACSVAEARETDNVASSSYTVLGADLWIQQLTVQVDGSSATIFADVCNAGTAASAGFEVGFYFDASVAPHCQSVPSEVRAAGGLDPAICHTVTATRADLSTGSRQAWALADQGCDVAEDDETNNTASSNYAIVPRPDLRITELLADVDGDAVRFAATVCNSAAEATSAPSSTGIFYGRADAPPDDCSAAADRLEPLAAVPPGACVAQTWTRVGVVPGPHGVHALADADCEVLEEDETNNLARTIFEVTAPTWDAGPRDAATGDGSPPRDTGADDASSGDRSPAAGDAGCACQIDRDAGSSAPWALLLLLLWRRRVRG